MAFLVFNEEGLQFMLRAEAGMVGRDLERRVVRVVDEAKQNATGRPVATAVGPTQSLFGGGLATRGAGGRFQRSRHAEAQRSLNQAGRGPRIQTGALHDSITGEVVKDDHGDLMGVVGTNVEYGFYLETGLRNGATYPFLTPALAAAGENV